MLVAPAALADTGVSLHVHYANIYSRQGSQDGAAASAIPAARLRVSYRGRLSAGGGLPTAVLLSPGSGYDNRRGSALVRALQLRLARAGDGPGAIDGRYGPLTERAVTRFQAADGLHVDGIAGPQTVRALNAPSPVLYPGAGYESGGSGPVRALQRRLARAHFAPGPIDGLYGPLTARAVRRLQATHRLPVNGIADAHTLGALRQQGSSHAQIRHRSHHRANPARPRPKRQPTRPTHHARRRNGHPAGGTPTGWILGLGAAVLGLVLLTATLRVRRRRTDRLPEMGNGSAGSALKHRTRAGVPLDPQEDLAAAEVDARRADEQGGADGAFRLGVLLQEQGDMAGAREAYSRADERGHAAAASNLGVLLELQGDRAGAESAYRRADRGGDANGAFNLGVLLEERGDNVSAESAYRRGDERGNIAASCNLGVLLERRRDIAGAEAAYRRADRSGDANGPFNLGMLLEEQGDLAGAAEAYRRADERGDANVAQRARAALLDLREHAEKSGASRDDG